MTLDSGKLLDFTTLQYLLLDFTTSISEYIQYAITLMHQTNDRIWTKPDVARWLKQHIKTALHSKTVFGFSMSLQNRVMIGLTHEIGESYQTLTVIIGSPKKFQAKTFFCTAQSEIPNFCITLKLPLSHYNR